MTRNALKGPWAKWGDYVTNGNLTTCDFCKKPGQPRSVPFEGHGDSGNIAVDMCRACAARQPSARKHEDGEYTVTLRPDA